MALFSAARFCEGDAWRSDVLLWRCASTFSEGIAYHSEVPQRQRTALLSKVWRWYCTEPSGKAKAWFGKVTQRKDKKMKFSPDVKRLNPHLKDADLVSARVTKSGKSKKPKCDTADDLYTVWERHANVRTPFPQREFVFSKSRACRFDFAWPRNRRGGGLAVEMDGGQYLPRGGRHNTDSDRAKLNLAGELGWIVLRYTPDMLVQDPIGIVEQIERTLINLKLWKPE